MDTQALIAAAGSLPALAARLGVSIQTVYTWKARGIPEVRQAWIREKAPELLQPAQDALGSMPAGD